MGIKEFFTLEKHHIILKIIFKAVKEKNPFPRLPKGYEEYVELAKKSNSAEIKEFERRCKILHDYANRRAWFEYALDIIAFVLTYSHDLSANPYQKFEYKKSSPVIPNLIVEQ